MKRHSFEEVKDFVEKQGQVLLSEDYVNNHNKLLFKCPEGHIYKMDFSHFQMNHRCPVCAINKKKHSIEEIRSFVENQGQLLLSKEYMNAHNKLQFQCPEGHIYKMIFNNFQQGKRCPVCAIYKKKLTIEEVKDFVENQRQVLLSEDYVNNYTKLRFKCSKGHIYDMSFNHFQQGKRCPVCAKKFTTSKAEREILDHVRSIYKGTILPNDRTQIINPKTGYGLELDIYMPEINKAIEYNGSFYHAEPCVKYKDEQKVIQCQQKGIDLLVITDKEWIEDRESCIFRIDNFVSDLNNKDK